MSFSLYCNECIAESYNSLSLIRQIFCFNGKIYRYTRADYLGKQGQIMNVKVSGELKNLLKNSELPIILERVGYMPILDAEQLTV